MLYTIFNFLIYLYRVGLYTAEFEVLTEVLNRKSVYSTALVVVEKPEGRNIKVELNVECSR
jgi:hypothetical protein